MRIELSEEPEPISVNLYNLKAAETAVITSISMDWRQYSDEEPFYEIELTAEKLAIPVFKGNVFALKSLAGMVVNHLCFVPALLWQSLMIGTILG